VVVEEEAWEWEEEEEEVADEEEVSKGVTISWKKAICRC
jgi:hypothetical protein